MVSKIIFDMKRGKAADIYGLTVEHLQYYTANHFILQSSQSFCSLYQAYEEVRTSPDIGNN